MPFHPPLADIAFALKAYGTLPGTQADQGAEDAAGLPDEETLGVILSEAGRMAQNVLAPLNRVGDTQGSRLENGKVRSPEGFAAAYGRFVEGGWMGLSAGEEYGGQGLPWRMTAAVSELWNAANMSFAVSPLLTNSAIELLENRGTPEQKAAYLPSMIRGSWTATMNMTESSAGSDIGALTTSARAEGDHWRIFGQKIFITWGDHDMTDNIVHMVLARIEGAPAGSRGISLFIVPKMLPEGDLPLGKANDLRCISLEHKLGLRGSPTAVMSYGDEGGAWGEILGGPREGLKAMFTMMNTARLMVAVQGVGLAERATQRALAYARERRQGRVPDSNEYPVPIIRHPDVRRQLLTMKAKVEAARALILFTAAALDRQQAAGTPDATLALLTPIAKAWSSDAANEVASLGIQVHGGLGFIEETGAAQHLRDARILAIYEGTNGIQAEDLVHRKVAIDGGEIARALIAALWRGVADASLEPAEQRALADAKAAFEQALAALLAMPPQNRSAVSTPFLSLMGTFLAGLLLARGPAAATRLTADAWPPEITSEAFLAARRRVLSVYLLEILPTTEGLARIVTQAGSSILPAMEEGFLN